MRIIYVVDTISDLNKKIHLLTSNLIGNMVFVVRADLVDLFKTYGYTPNAIYYNNLTKIIHTYLLGAELDDIVICYASLDFDRNLLISFANKIGNKTKIVNVMPQYNQFEQMCNSIYNIYVKSMFKAKDSMCTPKLQFIPTRYLPEFLSTHLGNRLFELNEDAHTLLEVKNTEISDSMKIKPNTIKLNIIAIIFALIITALLVATIAYLKVNYLLVLSCIILYCLDFVLTLIFKCKQKFDARFLK